jgi:hypothetical protein
MSSEQGARSHTEPLTVPDGADQLAIPVAGLHATELLDRVVSGYPVGRETDVPLKFGQPGSGEIPEDPVDAPGIEPQSAQSLLELGNIVPAEHRTPKIEETVAELKPSFDQRAPGLATTNPIDPESPLTLEAFDGYPRTKGEGATFVHAEIEPHGAEALLDVHHGLSARTLVERDGVTLLGVGREWNYRYASRSWRS